MCQATYTVGSTRYERDQLLEVTQFIWVTQLENNSV